MRVIGLMLFLTMLVAAADAQQGVETKITVAEPATEPVDLSSGPQLFIDEYLIAKSDGVQKVTQHPQRFLDDPILGWQQHTTQPYVTVLRDADTDKFRMWYNYDIGQDSAIAYAESDDGIKWNTPQLGIMGPDNRLFKIGRSQEHGSYGVSVIDDAEHAKDPQQRYKLMWWSGVTHPAGVSIAWSPDGLHWTQYEKNPVLPLYIPGEEKVAVGVGDIVDLFYDPIRGRYASLFKLHGVQADNWAPGPRAGQAFRRIVGQSVSEDFFTWETPWRVAVPEPRDEGLLEFYGAGGTIVRGPLLITFLRMLHDDYSPEPGVLDEKGVTPGLGYTTLATSRDGESWERHDDIFFDRNPQSGTWDRAMTWVGSAVPVGEELYLYYGGYARGHKIEATKERQLGLAKMPMDRFVARESSGEKPGTLLTVPLLADASRTTDVFVNADASKGQIRVQVRDAAGKVVPGLRFAECQPITGNGIALQVKWGGDVQSAGFTANSQEPAKNETVQLEFELINARLFGFEVR